MAMKAQAADNTRQSNGHAPTMTATIPGNAAIAVAMASTLHFCCEVKSHHVMVMSYLDGAMSAIGRLRTGGFPTQNDATCLLI